MSTMSEHDKNNPGADKFADDFMKQFIEGDPLSNEQAAESNGEPEVARAAENQTLEKQILEEQVILALKEVYDPELPVNIYDLGLIYAIRIDDESNVEVDMTLTTPGCPVAQTFPGQIEAAVAKVEGVNRACVELVWEPAWTKERMSESALLACGLF